MAFAHAVPPGCGAASSRWVSGKLRACHFRGPGQRNVITIEPRVAAENPATRNPAKVVRLSAAGDSPAEASGGLRASDPPAKLESQNAQSSWLNIVPDAMDNRSLWSLAACGCLWTVSNLMVVSILPIYMKSELGLSSTKIGALEGAAIAAAFLSKVFSGVVSDAVGSRVGVILFGAFMTAAVKPMFACSGWVNGVWGGVVAFQFICAAKIIDRLSKGVRAAPTDALLADLSPGDSRNRAYSLNQSLATFGGFGGSLACSLAMYVTASNYSLTFAIATVPALLASLLLLVSVKQPNLDGGKVGSKNVKPTSGVSVAKLSVEGKPSFLDRIRSATQLSGKFYFSAIIVSMLYLARFSESFVMLRARSVGTPLALIPLIATANQLVQGTLTYPMGLLADLFSARVVLVIGWIMIILAHIVFFSVPNVFGSVLGFVLVGIHMSMTQANSKSMLSQNLSAGQRGAGFAAFSVISGLALTIGNILAGWCNDLTVQRGLGMVGCFYSGALWSSLSLVLLLVYNGIYRSDEGESRKAEPKTMKGQ